MDLSIDLLVRLIAILSVLIMCFYLYMAFKRRSEVSRQKIKDIFIQEKQDKWYQYFIHDAPFTAEMIPVKDNEIQGLEDIFLSYLQNISDPTIKEKIRDFSNQYLRQHYLKLLHSKRWSIRMNAIYRISNFGIDSLADECRKMGERKPSKAERFQLLVNHSNLNADTFLEEFLPLSATFSEYEYKKLLFNVNSEILKKLTSQMDELPLNCQYSIIDVLGFKGDMAFLPFLESSLQHENTEVRIRALKAINEIGVVTGMEKYLPFVDSSVWEERLMAAKLLGNLPLSDVYQYLRKLLQDDSWWVRSQAAKTIGNSKHGKEKLQSYAETATDTYAADMAKEVLKGGML